MKHKGCGRTGERKWTGGVKEVRAAGRIEERKDVEEKKGKGERKGNRAQRITEDRGQGERERGRG